MVKDSIEHVVDSLNDSLQTVCNRIQEADKTLYAIWRDNGK